MFKYMCHIYNFVSIDILYTVYYSHFFQRDKQLKTIKKGKPEFMQRYIAIKRKRILYFNNPYW